MGKPFSTTDEATLGFSLFDLGKKFSRGFFILFPAVLAAMIAHFCYSVHPLQDNVVISFAPHYIQRRRRGIKIITYEKHKKETKKKNTEIMI